MSTARQPAISVAKGHGTQNDFVIVDDPMGEWELTDQAVQALCDRRAGIGGDGILRLVQVEHSPEAQQLTRDTDTDAQWFMDYRNADGSIASMCGNGARVFVRALHEQGRVSTSGHIVTRGGVRSFTVNDDDSITVELGEAVEGLAGDDPVVRVGATDIAATAWWLPNPHAVVFVDDLAQVGDLLTAPTVMANGRFPNGQNVEFVVDDTDESTGELAVHMRVHERGVGETRSCGTGAAAAALATRHRHGVTHAGSVQVDVPGGRLTVLVDEAGVVSLQGPAEIVARGTIDQNWWDSHGHR